MLDMVYIVFDQKYIQKPFNPTLRWHCIILNTWMILIPFSSGVVLTTLYDI